MCCVRDIQEIRLFSRTHTSAEALAKELASTYPKLTVIAANSRPEAVKEADIVVTATNSSTPVFDGRDLMPGTHINAIGSFRPDMQEVDECTVQRAKLVVDQREAALSEAGDIIVPIRKGIITEQHVYAELGEIILGKKLGRDTDDEITFFKSVGNAAQDVAIAQLVLKSAQATNSGALVPF
jgi:ornithine cyclodeaminase